MITYVLIKAQISLHYNMWPLIKLNKEVRFIKKGLINCPEWFLLNFTLQHWHYDTSLRIISLGESVSTFLEFDKDDSNPSSICYNINSTNQCEMFFNHERREIWAILQIVNKTLTCYHFTKFLVTITTTIIDKCLMLS